MTVFFDDYSDVAFQLHMCYMFGVLLSGNIVDNIATPKYFAIFAQTLLAAFWIGSGFFLYIDQGQGCDMP